MRDNLQIFFWMLSLGWKGNRALFLSVLVVQIIALMLQIGAAVLVAIVVQNLLSGETGSSEALARFGGIQVLALSAVLLVVLSAVANFAADRILIRFQRRQEELLTVSIFEKVRLLDAAAFANAPVKLTIPLVQKMVNLYARLTAVSQRLLVRAIVPSLALLGLTVFLITMEWRVLGLLAVFFICALVPLWWVNRKALTISSTFEALALRANSIKAQYLRDLDLTTQGVGKEGSSAIVELEAVRKFNSTFEQRVLISNQASLVVSVVGALSLGGILVLFSAYSTEFSNLSGLVVLFLMLQFSLRSFQTVSSLVTSVNRFFTQFRMTRQMYEWQPNAHSDVSDTSSRERTLLPLTATVTLPNKSTADIRFAKGEARFVIAPAPLRRMSAYALLRDLGLSAREGFSATSEPVLVYNPSDDGAPRLQERDEPTASLSDPWDKLAGLEKEISTAALAFLRALQAATESGREMIFIEQSGMMRLPVKVANEIPALLKNFDVTFFCSRRMNIRRSLGVNSFVVHNGEAITAVMNMEEFSKVGDTLDQLLSVGSPAGIDPMLMGEDD